MYGGRREIRRRSRRRRSTTREGSHRAPRLHGPVVYFCNLVIVFYLCDPVVVYLRGPVVTSEGREQAEIDKERSASPWIMAAITPMRARDEPPSTCS